MIVIEPYNTNISQRSSQRAATVNKREMDPLRISLFFYSSTASKELSIAYECICGTFMRVNRNNNIDESQQATVNTQMTHYLFGCCLNVSILFGRATKRRIVKL